MAGRSGQSVPATCATCRYTLERKVSRKNKRKEPELYVIWQLWCTVPAVTLPLTISSRRTHWPSSCCDKYLTPLGTCLSECFRCLVYDLSGVEPQESHKRRLFPSAVAYDMMKPMIDYRSQSANISHMPTVSRAMLAIGVEPVTSTSAQSGSKKRGRCCPRSQEQKVDHRCAE